MDEVTNEANNPNNEPDKKPAKLKKDRSGFKKVLAVLGILLLMGASAYAGYWYREEQAKKDLKEKQSQIDTLIQEKSALQKQLDEASADEEAEDTAKPSASDLENIEAAISSGNTAALEGFMADKVFVIMAATECCGSRAPAQAVADLAYVEAGTDPWDFDLPAATRSSYASGDYADYLPTDALVGKSANGYVVGFTFDSAGDIDGVFMAGSASGL